MKKSLQRILFSSLILIVAISLIGCAGGVLSVLVEPASYNKVEVEKINLTTMLYLDEAFRNAKWENEPIGFEANVIELGENFTINAKNLANAVFSDVVIITSQDEISKDKGDVILMPKVKSSKQNRPYVAWNDSTLTVIMEWSLKDTENNLLWITNIKGEGVARVGKDKERLQSLINDLFKKSYNAITSSPEIKDYEKMNN